MSHFTKKHNTVEAVQFKHIEAPNRIVFYGNEVPQWITDAMAVPEGQPGSIWIEYPDQPTASNPLAQPRVRIPTSWVNPDDWIVKSEHGFEVWSAHGFAEQFSPCDPAEDFSAAFEEREAQDQPSFADIVDRLDAAKAKRRGIAGDEPLTADSLHPELSVAPSPHDQVQAAIHADPEHAWGWQCNLAIPIMDAIGCSHEDANTAAAHLMDHLWDYDITKHEHFKGKKSGAQQYAEMRKEAERQEDVDFHYTMIRGATDGGFDRKSPEGHRIGALGPQQSREELMRSSPRRTVQPDRVAQAITDPIIRAYVEGMGSMMLDLQQDCIELRARIRAARRLVHAFLGSVEQSEAYERVMDLLKDD